MNEFDVPSGFWRSMCEDAEYPMACVAKDNRFTWVNSAFERLVGYSVAELVGKTWMEITVQNDVGGDLASVEAVMKGRITHYTMAKAYRHKRGHVVQVELTVRRFPPSVLEDLLCFRVESPIAQPSRAEIEQLESHFLDIVSDLKRRIEQNERIDQLKEKGGVTVNTGNQVGGDMVGRDKRTITNSETALKVAGVAIAVIACAMAWLFYYVTVMQKPGVTPVPPPSIQVPE